MLERLFVSKTRIKLLRLFLTNESEVFYLKDIIKKTGLDTKAIKKELDNLKKLDLISERKNKIIIEPFKKPRSKRKKKKAKIIFKKSYSLNKNFVLYSELKALIIKSQILLEEFLIKKLKKLGKVYYLALSGFFTNASSKTDLLIVGRINRKKIKHLIKKLEKDLGRAINYTVMSLSEFKFRSDLTDRFIFDVLENKKVVLIDELHI